MAQSRTAPKHIRRPDLALGYARDSGGPSQERSVPDQCAALERYAAQHGYTITAWYTDEALSGRTDDRPAFQRLIAAATDPGCQAGVILVWDYARFGREETDRAYYLAVLAKAGVQVRSATQQLPAAGANIMREVLAFADAEYARQLAVNVTRGHQAVLARGYLPGGAAPVGYQVVRDLIGKHRDGTPRHGLRWVIDEDAAPRVRQAFALRAAGVPIRAIVQATALCSTRQGMHHILANPAYRGVYVYRGQEHPGLVPALVDDATWHAAQQQPALHPRAAGGDYLLSGLLRCGYCGAAMTGHSSQRQFKNGTLWRKRYYTCTRRNTVITADRCRAPSVPADDLEMAVREIIFRDLLQPDAFLALVAAARAIAEQDGHTRRAADLAARIARAERTIRDLIDLAGAGIQAVDLLAAKIKTQESELTLLRQQQASLPTVPALLRADEPTLRAHVAHLAAGLTGDLPQQRHILHRLIATLTYGPELTLTCKAPGEF